MTPEKAADRDLIGVWHLESADAVLEMNDPIEMEFHPDGKLTYAVESVSGWHIMQLVYSVEGRWLVTDQPSSPRQERTEFHLDDHGALVLNYGMARCKFVRGIKKCPVSYAVDGPKTTP